MLSQVLAYAGLGMIMITSLLLLLGQNKRYGFIGLAVQYLGVFLLVVQVWPFGLALIKLIAGWMSVAVLTATLFSQKDDGGVDQSISSTVFKILLGVLIWVLIFTVSPSIIRWLPIPYVFLWSGLILFGVGLLQLALSNLTYRVIIGLLTIFSGFEILYAVVENSTLVTLLLAVVNLGLAIAGAYTISISRVERSE